MSIKRIQDFLVKDETESVEIVEDKNEQQQSPFVKLENLSAKWSQVTNIIKILSPKIPK